MTVKLEQVFGERFEDKMVRLPLQGETTNAVLNMDKLYAETDKYVGSIQDFTLPTSDVSFTHDGATIYLNTSEGRFQFTQWSMGQMCNRVGVPTLYLHKMIKAGMFDLAVENLNKWLAKQPQDKNMLLRTYGDRIRGVLSDKYLIMDNHELIEMLDHSLNATGKFYTAERFVISPESMYLRIIENEMLPVNGEDLFAGFAIRNSDVGKSSLVIDLMVYKLICANGLILGGGSGRVFARRHIGKVNKETFTEDVHKIVAQMPDYMEYVRDVITSAKQVKITSAYLQELVDDFKEKMKATEEVTKKVTEYMTSKYEVTLWGYINAITEVAQEYSAERQEELERYAGELLESVR